MMIGLAGSLLSSLAPILLVLRCRAFQQQPTRFEKNHPRGCDNRLGIECRSVADPNSCIKNSPEVLCVGETLYDCLPEAIFLGGATTNVGVHLSCMGTSTAVVTSLGSDQLGNEAIRRLQIKGVNTDYIQKHPNLGTGMVTAELDENGDASYTFDTPAAWDGIELTDELHELLRNDNGSSSVKVIVIGTIASRLGSDQGSTTAASISELRNLAKDDTIVLDVNLRAPWYDPESILALSRGDGKGKRLAIVKLNEEELPIVEKWCGADDSSKKSLRGEKLKQRLVELGNSLNARRVCVTRGGDGAALWCNNEDGTDDFVEHDGYDCDEEPGFDTVRKNEHCTGTRDWLPTCSFSI